MSAQDAARKRRQREREAARGLATVAVVVPAEAAGDLRHFARALRNGREAATAALAAEVAPEALEGAQQALDARAGALLREFASVLAGADAGQLERIARQVAIARDLVGRTRLNPPAS